MKNLPMLVAAVAMPFLVPRRHPAMEVFTILALRTVGAELWERTVPAGNG